MMGKSCDCSSWICRASVLLIVLVASESFVFAQEANCAATANACEAPTTTATVPSTLDRAPKRILFFWGHGCPHCEEAKPFLRQLAELHPGLHIERIEVRRDPAGQAHFQQTVHALDISAPGIPLFVVGDRWLVGFTPDASEDQILELIDGGRIADNAVALPGIGRVDFTGVPLLFVSLAIGLVDGVNPCAIYVLVVLLGLMMRLQSTGRMILYGSIFVITSGVVYFGFMTVWFNVFLFAGLADGITIALGSVLILMGLTNLKELVWFKQGFSLMIPEAAKGGLFARMRSIGRTDSLWVAVPAIFTLALVVNLVELGCTIGLPAVFTRMLSLREEVGVAQRYFFLATYNLAYVVPLGLIVLAFVVLRRRLILTEEHAKVLKAVSGALLLVFGLTFVFFPELLR